MTDKIDCISVGDLIRFKEDYPDKHRDFEDVDFYFASLKKKTTATVVEVTPFLTKYNITSLRVDVLDCKNNIVTLNLGTEYKKYISKHFDILHRNLKP